MTSPFFPPTRHQFLSSAWPPFFGPLSGGEQLNTLLFCPPRPRSPMPFFSGSKTFDQFLFFLFFFSHWNSFWALFSPLSPCLLTGCAPVGASTRHSHPFRFFLALAPPPWAARSCFFYADMWPSGLINAFFSQLDSL